MVDCIDCFLTDYVNFGVSFSFPKIKVRTKKIHIGQTRK